MKLTIKVAKKYKMTQNKKIMIYFKKVIWKMNKYTENKSRRKYKS